MHSKCLIKCVKENTECDNTIAGLSYDTNEPVLKNEFEKYGEIIEGRIRQESY